jgi:hypothetical protein
MMRRAPHACAGIILLGGIMGWLAWRHDAAMLLRGIMAPAADHPENGTIADGRYTNGYFGLSYRLPPEWTVAEAGPDPSQSAYYVLSTLVPHGELNATIMIAAQDMFFSAERHAGVADQARDFQKSLSTIAGMTIEPEVARMKVGDRDFYRVDYNGVGLYRSMVAVEIRCHALSFNVTARDPALLERLVRSLDSDLSWGRAAADGASPPCAKDYADGDNILHKVSPVPVGPRFTPIPVRIIVGADGDVKNVHVIRATDDQRRSIETALYQWKLKPYTMEGRAGAVETGLVFKFAGDS